MDLFVVAPYVHFYSFIRSAVKGHEWNVGQYVSCSTVYLLQYSFYPFNSKSAVMYAPGTNDVVSNLNLTSCQPHTVTSVCANSVVSKRVFQKSSVWQSQSTTTIPTRI